jgi:hypothetical protein
VNRGGGDARGVREGKVFFFEEKKQKTFVIDPSKMGADSMDKSFLVLFFKKELLA